MVKGHVRSNMITTIAVGLVILGSIAVLAKIAVNKFNEIKETQMSLLGKVEELRGAVGDLAARVAALPSAGLVAELEAAIEAERAAAIALAELEDQEDVEQNAALDEARSEVDRLISEAAEVEAALDGVKSDVEAIAAADVPDPEETEEPDVEVDLPLDPEASDDNVDYEGEPETATEDNA